MWGFIRGVWCARAPRLGHLAKLVGFLGFRSGCEILVHFAGFHDENDAAGGGGVIERVAAHGDDIGVHARSDGANFVDEP